MADVFKRGIKNETGIIFGFPGNPYLAEAIARAGAGDRKVGVIAAANLAAVVPFEDKIVGSVAVDSSAELNDLVVDLRKVKSDEPQIDALVFYGLSEYANRVLAGICGTKSPEQSQYGEMARIVANDLRLLTSVAPVLYVTCDVAVDIDDKTKARTSRLNIIPGLQKLLLGDLNSKIYIATRLVGGDSVTVIQDNPKLALDFQLPRPARDEVPAAADKPDAADKKTRKLA